MCIRKNIVSRIFLLGEIIFFIVFCCFSPAGIPQYIQLKKESHEIIYTVKSLEADIATITSDIDKWNTDPFYKEKTVREQLQMAKSDEEVFFIKL